MDLLKFKVSRKGEKRGTEVTLNVAWSSVPETGWSENFTKC